MIDLHTHTLFSDGELVPAELARRADKLGYRWLAITDHVDGSTLEHAIRGAVAAAAELARYWKIRVLPGAELTHNPPELLPELIREARRMGARVVVVHGETIDEPVPEGTNAM
ncbi:MAG: histidinol phosphate phosphatase domain-containing protein, partial [Candidatus Methylomirabilia bacterium]